MRNERAPVLIALLVVGCSGRDRADTSALARVDTSTLARAISDPDSVTHHGDTTTFHEGALTITIRPGPPVPIPTDSLVRGPADYFLLQELDSSAELRQDTIHFYSDEGRAGWDFEGRPLSPEFNSLFAFQYNGLSPSSDEPQLFVAGRVKLDSSLVGYVLRVPGMYSSSQLDLWIYDRTTDRFELPLRLAETWGDAGYFFSEESWMVLLSSGKPSGLFQRRWHSNVDLDSGTVTLDVDTLYRRSWANNVFGAANRITDATLQARFTAADRNRSH